MAKTKKKNNNLKVVFYLIPLVGAIVLLYYALNLYVNNKVVFGKVASSPSVEFSQNGTTTKILSVGDPSTNVFYIQGSGFDSNACLGYTLSTAPIHGLLLLQSDANGNFSTYVPTWMLTYAGVTGNYDDRFTLKDSSVTLVFKKDAKNKRCYRVNVTDFTEVLRATLMVTK